MLFIMMENTSISLINIIINIEEISTELEEEINISVNPHKCSFVFQAICTGSDTITYITDDVLEIPTTPFINDEGAMVSFQPIAKLINENDSLFYEYNLKLFKSLNNDLDYIQYQK